MLLITAAPVNPPAVPNSQHYHTHNTTNYCSCCQSPCLTASHNIIIHNTLVITAAPLNHPALPSHNIIIHKTLLIPAAPVNPPAVPNSQLYLAQNATNYCSCCQSPFCTQVTILSYTKRYQLLQFLSIPLPYHFHNIFIHKSPLVTAASVNPPAIPNSQHDLSYH